MKNWELIKLRNEHKLTQQQAADALGISKATYNLVENGKRRGSVDFWLGVQKLFRLKDSEVWKLQYRI